jgi:hypothetical protein
MWPRSRFDDEPEFLARWSQSESLNDSSRNTHGSPLLAPGRRDDG